MASFSSGVLSGAVSIFTVLHVYLHYIIGFCLVIKGATSWFAHVETFILDFSNSWFVICV